MAPSELDLMKVCLIIAQFGKKEKKKQTPKSTVTIGKKNHVTPKQKQEKKKPAAIQYIQIFRPFPF